MTTAVAQPTARLDAWRIGWTLDGRLMSPLRGAGSDGFGVSAYLMGKRKNLMSHGRVIKAECHPRGQETASAPPGHRPPHPDCYCGVHGCERLQHIEHLADAMWGPLQILTSTYRTRFPDKQPPGIAVYRVVLRGAVESALYKHAKPDGRGFRGDPPGTWRAAEAEVVGPIVATSISDMFTLAKRYGVPAVYRGADIREVVSDLMRLEPATESSPCDRCGFRTGHAVECSLCVPWWEGRAP